MTTGVFLAVRQRDYGLASALLGGVTGALIDAVIKRRAAVEPGELALNGLGQ